VTGLDLAPNLLEQARQRAKDENLQIKFDEGDAEKLPYADRTFDMVVSMFGSMFAPRPDVVAAELVRVCKPGGVIATANWTPQGFIGKNFALTARHVPPPPGVPAPVQWGDESIAAERMSKAGARDVKCTRYALQFKYPFPPRDVVELFRTYFGPTKTAFARLEAAGQAALARDLEQLWSEHNQATDGGTEIKGEYLEVVCRR
jgi:SAM-dependent methyltransferase